MFVCCVALENSYPHLSLEHLKYRKLMELSRPLGVCMWLGECECAHKVSGSVGEAGSVCHINKRVNVCPMWVPGIPCKISSEESKNKIRPTFLLIHALTFAHSSIQQIARCKLRFPFMLALNLPEMSNGVGILRMIDVDHQINTSLVLALAYLLSPAVSGGFTLAWICLNSLPFFPLTPFYLFIFQPAYYIPSTLKVHYRVWDARMDTLPVFPAHVKYVEWNSGGMHPLHAIIGSVKSWSKCVMNDNERRMQCSSGRWPWRVCK